MTQRHIPERTCVACRSPRPKREMVRVVRTATGTVEVDLTGKKSGRGAYLCRQPDCWQRAIRRKALDHALKVELSATDREALATFGDELPAIGNQASAIRGQQLAITSQESVVANRPSASAQAADN